MKQLIVMLLLDDDHPWASRPPEELILVDGMVDGAMDALRAELATNNRRNMVYLARPDDVPPS